MITISTGEFNGMTCCLLDNGRVRLAVTTDRGPRVVFWGWAGGENLLAELPTMCEEVAAGSFYFVGGHRLWYGPELRERTYWPDNDPPAVTATDDGASFTAPADGAGVVKSISLSLTAASSTARVTHTLYNSGPAPLELAPWAITMCRPGGVALLPQPQQASDGGGLLPNRLYSLWPYSDLRDPRLTLGDHIILVQAAAGSRNKLGYRSTNGWVGYWRADTLFSKHFDPQLTQPHPDFGANAECYVESRFLEIESLGPLLTLLPQQTVTHEELWRLHHAPGPLNSEAEASAMIGKLGL